MASYEPTYWNPEGDAESQAIYESKGLDPLYQAMNSKLQSLAPEGAPSFLLTNMPEEAAKQREAGGLYQYEENAPATTSGGGTLFGVGSSLSEPFKAITSIMDAIDKEPDTTKKQQLLIGLEASTGEYISKEAAKARARASEELGIDSLRQQLEENEMLDRQDPLYQQFRSDSKATQQVRQRLAQTEQGVDNHAQRLMAENGELVRYTKTINGYMKLQQGLIQKKEIADINKAKTLEEKQAAVNGLMESILPEVKESFYKDNPALRDPNAFAGYLAGQKSPEAKKDLGAILSGEIRPDNYLQAGLAGNGVALRLAAAEQADRTGMDRSMVESQLTQAAKFVRDPEAFLAAAPALGMKTKDIKELQSAMLLGGKEGKAKVQELALSLSDKYLSKLNESAINADILGWKKAAGEISVDQLPGAAAIIQEIQKNKGTSKVDIESFAAAYLGQPGLSRQEKMERQQLLGDKYITTLERARGGLYGREIDTVGLTNRLLTRTTLALTDPSFGGGMQAAGSGLMDLLSGRGNLQYGAR